MGLFKKQTEEQEQFEPTNTMDGLINEIWIKELHKDFSENRIELYNKITELAEDVKRKCPEQSEDLCLRNACSFVAFPYIGKSRMQEDELIRISNEIYHLYIRIKDLLEN